MLADLIFKEMSQTTHMTNIKKIFLNINFKQFMLKNIPILILLAIYRKLPEAWKLATSETFEIPFSLTFFLFFTNFPD